jgi:hypothetical protein
MGAVGKSSIATAVANLVLNQFPEGQFVIDLRGTSENPLTSTEAMMMVVEGLHPEVRAPATEQETIGLYNSVLGRLKCIIIFDDVRDEDQIAKILLLPQCLALMTSRTRLSLTSCFQIGVSPLQPQDSDALLLAIEPRISPTVSSISAICGHLPLALRICAASLRAHVDISAEDYLTRLRDEVAFGSANHS